MTVFWGASAVHRGTTGHRYRDSVRSAHYWVRQACLFAFAMWLMLARAHAGSGDVPIVFDIPAQELTGALQAFSRDSGRAVLVDRQLTLGRRSLGVKGRFSAAQGLNLMLTGTGLMARYSRADAVTLQVAQVGEVSLPKGFASSGANPASNSYAAAIQSAIERRLCGSTLTRPGTFRALLQLWIGRDGAVQHSRLVTSSGDVERDAALVESVQHLKIERAPPSSVRQPVTLLLVPDLPGKRMDCIQQEGAFGA